LDSFSDWNSAEVSGLKGMIRYKKTKINNNNIGKIDEKIDEEDEENEQNNFGQIQNNLEEKEIVSSITKEGYVNKFDHYGKIKKTIWMVLIGKDLLYFENNEKKESIKVHNINNCFIRENGEVTTQDKKKCIHLAL
jgi:hypothetical protein